MMTLMNNPNQNSARWGISDATSSSETNQQVDMLGYGPHMVAHLKTSPMQNVEENSSNSSGAGATSLPGNSPNSVESHDPALFPISNYASCSNGVDEDSTRSSTFSTSNPNSPANAKGKKPARNANTKTKSHKCRSCGLMLPTKPDLWRHSIEHMRPEKVQHCPMADCPFVTEYKHHLDFHVQNHKGDKPFKCKQCNYQCVNKSMLKSHSKSHSSIYPFKCQNCGYKTKYIHSIKIHLRREHGHQLAVILDEFGNPDTSSFVDIYSNRRGPKRKKKAAPKAAKSPPQSSAEAKNVNSKEQPQPVQMPQPGQQQPAPPESTPPLPVSNFAISQLYALGAWSVENPALGCPLISPPMLMPAAAAPEMAKYLLSNQETDSLNNNGLTAVNQNGSPTYREPHLALENGVVFGPHKEEPMSEDESGGPDAHPAPSLTVMPFYPAFLGAANNGEAVAQSVAPLNLSPRRSEEPAPSAEAPLNLSVSHATSQFTGLHISNPSASSGNSGGPGSSTSNGSVSVTSNKNRRKGIACKLKRCATTAESGQPDEAESEQKPQLVFSELAAAESGSSHESGACDTNVGGADAAANVPSAEVACASITGAAEADGASPQNSVTQTLMETDAEAASELRNPKCSMYRCEFCEITFGNQIMFSLHKGCHGFADPFTCNRCGAKTDNKIDFYEHMISSAHLS